MAAVSKILVGRSFALLGGVMNIVSGKALETLPRAVAGFLSITGNSTGWVAEKFFIDKNDKDNEESSSESTSQKVDSKVERAKNWIAGRQLILTNAQKGTGSVFLIASGVATQNHAESVSGIVYTISNTLELTGEKGRAYWLTSTALSGVGAGAMIVAGVNARDPAQIAAGASYGAAAISLALANPQKYKSFRERIEAERGEEGKGRGV